MKNYAAIAEQYADDILSGAIDSSKYIQLACQRFKYDLNNKDFIYEFDANRAARACKFVELQYHTKGKWAAKKERLILQPWQVFFVANIFGWVDKQTKLRRYREALLLVPRKNGKSALAAAIGLYMLCADGEHGAEVYSGATSERQSWEVFKPAKLMASMNPEMTQAFGVEVNASNICIPETGAKFEPLIGKPGDGASPSCAIADEVHELKDSTLIDTMITGMGAREQGLMLYITTAGDNLAGPCYQMQLECQKNLEGVVINDRFFSLMYGIDIDDDWTTEVALKKANPNYDISVSGEFLKIRLAEALNNAHSQSVYKTKHLNVWVGAKNAFFNMQRWNDCAKPGLKIEDYLGRRCIIGLDLASKVDIAALRIVFPLDNGEFAVFGRYYLPEAALETGVSQHYKTWASEGWLTITEGEIIDFGIIRDEILNLSSMFHVEEVAYDPFQATMLVTELMQQGVPVVEMRPTVLNFSEPMKFLDGLIRARKILQNGDPVQTWMLSNVVASTDAKDNVYPRKDRPENKIDGAIAELMAIGRTMTQKAENQDINKAIFGMLSVKL